MKVWSPPSIVAGPGIQLGDGVPVCPQLEAEKAAEPTDAEIRTSVKDDCRRARVRPVHFQTELDGAPRHLGNQSGAAMIAGNHQSGGRYLVGQLAN